VHPLGGTLHKTIRREGAVIVRRLGWYGETAASRMLHSNRLRRNTHPGLNCASYTHAAVSVFLNCHRRGPVPLELRSAASNLPVMRFPRRRVDADAPQRFRWDRLHPALAACSHDLSERIICSAWWCPAAGGVRPNNSTFLNTGYLYANTHLPMRFHEIVEISENAAQPPDPPCFGGLYHTGVEL
jgi:hypothetical protein